MKNRKSSTELRTSSDYSVTEDGKKRSSGNGSRTSRLRVSDTLFIEVISSRTLNYLDKTMKCEEASGFQRGYGAH